MRHGKHRCGRPPTTISSAAPTRWAPYHCRQQRVQAAQEAKLQHPRHHLGGPDQRCQGDRRLGEMPLACSRRGRWAAMAVLVNQVTAKTKDSSTVVRRAWSGAGVAGSACMAGRAVGASVGEAGRFQQAGRAAASHSAALPPPAGAMPPSPRTRRASHCASIPPTAASPRCWQNRQSA